MTDLDISLYEPSDMTSKGERTEKPYPFPRHGIIHPHRRPTLIETCQASLVIHRESFAPEPWTRNKHMTPRPREEEDMLLSTPPPAFDRLKKRKAFPAQEKPLRRFSDEDSALTSSLRSISERSVDLLDEVDDWSRNKSLLNDACRGSLQNDMTSMVDDVQCLLEHTGHGPDSVTSCRASLAERQADSYLNIIESALKTPDRACVETELALFVNSIATQLHAGDEKKDDDVSLRISSWKMPKLAFVMTVGSPTTRILKASTNGGSATLPLSLEVRAIVEVLAQDIVDGRSLGSSYRACTVVMERCVHEPRSFSDSSGTLGDGLVRVRLSPVDGDEPNAFNRKGSTSSWRDSSDVGCLKVKEARVVQVNAVPPRPKTTVDLYASSTHGERDTTFTMRFQTCKTMNEESPDVRIELVMG